METYLLLAKSVTHAQQMLSALEKGGIRTKIRRAGAALTQQGCGYSLTVGQKDFVAAMERLRAAGQKPVKILLQRDNEYFEVPS